MSLSFKPKAYLRPKSETELSGLLQKFKERARIIAGGTGIYEVAHRGLLSDVEFLIDISALNLAFISMSKSTLKIGAATTMSSLFNSRELASRMEFAGVVDSLLAIQPLQVKNIATVGGAICTALPFFDLPVSLLSADASVILAPHGRRVKLSEFIQGYFAVGLDEGEFVKEIELPLSESRASAFQKFAITHDDWALINCASSLGLDHESRIVKPNIFFGGGVGSKPVRSVLVEAALSGIHCTNGAGIRAAFSENVSKDIQTVTDIRASSEYRMNLAEVMGTRAVEQAARRALSAQKVK